MDNVEPVLKICPILARMGASPLLMLKVYPTKMGVVPHGAL